MAARASDPLKGLSDLMQMGTAFFAADKSREPYGRGPPLRVFREVVDALKKKKVPFLLEGGWAVAAYGYERMTRDIDFIVPVAEKHARSAYKAMRSIGGKPVGKRPFGENEAAELEAWLISFRVEGWRVDLIKEPNIGDLLSRSLKMRVGGRAIQVIDGVDLIKRKRLRNSPKDQIDIRFLMDKMRSYDADPRG